MEVRRSFSFVFTLFQEAVTVEAPTTFRVRKVPFFNELEAPVRELYSHMKEIADAGKCTCL